QHVPANPANPGVGVRFVLFDGTPADSRFSGMLAKIGESIPHGIQDATWRELTPVISRLAAEVDRRQAEPGDTSPIYLFIFDLQRFRDLRKGEDDFGYGRYGEDKAPSASKLFGNILRDGPPVGVHTIIWCDSLNNLNRTFDRQGLKEFEIRILFQMSMNDSSALIDSPAGGKLGEHRAIFFSEEEGKIEKFRPYAYPPDEWLAELSQHLKGRNLRFPPAPLPELTSNPAPSSSRSSASDFDGAPPPPPPSSFFDDAPPPPPPSSFFDDAPPPPPPSEYTSLPSFSGDFGAITTEEDDSSSESFEEYEARLNAKESANSPTNGSHPDHGENRVGSESPTSAVNGSHAEDREGDYAPETHKPEES
ncbi:hypothetical protein ACYOEI_32860, partial [Singulisphaera rosea]